MRMGAGDGPRRFASSRINRFDQSGLTDRDIDTPSGRIEERHVRWTRDRPASGDVAGPAVDLDEMAIIAGGVETVAGVVDIETMGATRWEFPLDEQVQVGKPGHEDHRWLANTQKQPPGGRVRYAPARSAR